MFYRQRASRVRFEDAAGGNGAGGGSGDGDAGAAAKAAADAAGAAAAAKGTGDWTTSLTPEAKSLVTLKGWKTPAEALASYSGLEKLVGGDKIAAPRKDKDGNYEKGELERFLQAAGAPKDAKEYSLPKDLKMEAGTGLTPAALEQFKPIAQKYGLLPHQFQGIMAEFAGMLNAGAKQSAEQKEKAHNEAVTALRGEYGEAYDEKAGLANRVLRSFVDKNRADAIVQKYGSDPDIIKLLANVGENMSEDKIGASNMAGGTLTPAQAAEELRTITADIKHPLFVAGHKDHAYWVNRRMDLEKLAAAGK